MKETFFHHLRDTIILLGGGTHIANMASKPDEISATDVARLKDYNILLETQVKDRLANTNSMTIQIIDDDE